MTTARVRHTRPVGPAVALAALLAVSACSGGDDDAATTSAPPPPSAADRLAQAHDVVVDAGTLQMTMTGTDLPEDENSYIISATGSGTMDPPAFDGTITAKLAGVQADVPTVALDGELWVKLPYVPSHVRTDPADLGVPDPAALFDPDTGLVSLLEDTEDPEFGDRAREGEEIVQQVVGTLPGEAVTALLYVGDSAADFDVIYGLVEDSWEVRTVEITGPFYPSQPSTYTLTMDAYGEPVTVTRP